MFAYASPLSPCSRDSSTQPHYRDAYSATECHRPLGLPPASELEGLDLEVKSILVRPFSVMHPKFVIIDRKRVFLPSCNVSWEDWSEGCVELSGSVVGQFTEFWLRFWAIDRDQEFESMHHEDAVTTNGDANTTKPTAVSLQHPQQALISPTQPFEPLHTVPSIFLPSSHHRNPQFSFPPWRPCIAPPRTPLNMFIVAAFANSKRDIYVQTPNLTAPVVLKCLLRALRNGRNVTIVTSERLMILEQLVTAGTTTKRCVKKLINRHKELIKEWNNGRNLPPNTLESWGSLLPSGPGRLQIYYYRPDPLMVLKEKANGAVPEPRQLHLKLTIVDGTWTILGSGNLDRASWHTSQELGVAFNSSVFAADVRKTLDPLMERRKKLVYDGGFRPPTIG